MWASADSSPHPWLYPYQDDGARLERIVQRPIVPVALTGTEVTDGQFALVDSGCSHVLAAPWLADAAGVDPARSNRTIDLGIGGKRVTVRFVDMKLRLLSPRGQDSDYWEWEAEVGFFDEWRQNFTVILGQLGFLDQFTVTMSQFSRLTAVETVEAFDLRFGTPSLGS